MDKGDKLICLRTVKNYLNNPLFLEGDEYEVLYLTNDSVCLNHILYGNEYNHWEKNWVSENFKSRQELREETINKIIE